MTEGAGAQRSTEGGPGHMAVRVRSGDEQAVLIADSIPHPALLERPEWSFAFDEDAKENGRTRRALLGELLNRDVLAVCGHYPGSGIGRVVTGDDRIVWEEVPW